MGNYILDIEIEKPDWKDVVELLTSGAGSGPSVPTKVSTGGRKGVSSSITGGKKGVSTSRMDSGSTGVSSGNSMLSGAMTDPSARDSPSPTAWNFVS